MTVAKSTTRSYADLHEHLGRLDSAGLLYRIEAPVNKDTEMHPLVRWQFRGGIAEKDRKAFLFSRVVDFERAYATTSRWPSAYMRRMRRSIASA